MTIKRNLKKLYEQNIRTFFLMIEFNYCKSFKENISFYIFFSIVFFKF